MIDVTELTQTCDACPSQWEGRTADGRHVYVRYRWGCLQIGIGNSLHDAVNTDTITRQLGDNLHGVLSYTELKAATRDVVQWPL
jgi:hypothetical protein